MRRTSIQVEVPGGRLGGWRQGDGEPVLLLHGGPGLGYGYLDGVAADVGEGWEVAAFQQRGLEPSTTEGPFTVERAVADAVAVLDALGWERTWIVGHSWGGHLLLHLAVAAPERLHGGLAVDPLGGVGDGGTERFENEILARTPEEVRAEAKELDERAMRGEATAEDLVESLRLLWPAYFASKDHVMAFPEDMRPSIPAYAGLWESLNEALLGLAAALPGIRVPMGFVAGSASPMPHDDAAGATARAIPGAWLEVVEAAGHLPWHERPGCVRAALQRLRAG
jgi:pimeloyl-ACP methyl ester carboxylesterase